MAWHDEHTWALQTVQVQTTKKYDAFTTKHRVPFKIELIALNTCP
jgi:hypothetical protein